MVKNERGKVRDHNMKYLGDMELAKLIVASFADLPHLHYIANSTPLLLGKASILSSALIRSAFGFTASAFPLLAGYRTSVGSSTFSHAIDVNSPVSQKSNIAGVFERALKSLSRATLGIALYVQAWNTYQEAQGRVGRVNF